MQYICNIYEIYMQRICNIYKSNPHAVYTQCNVYAIYMKHVYAIYIHYIYNIYIYISAVYNCICTIHAVDIQ